MMIRSSGLARVMNCAGSLFFKDLPPQETNEAAKEGTAAAEYLERLVKRWDLPTHAKNGVFFNEDIRFYITDLYNQVREFAGNVEINAETPIDWVTRSGITIKGTYDLSFVKDGTLYVDDLKFGWGIVEVENNWQLIAYAIGEVIRRGTGFNEIVLRIHQPRPHHEAGPTREWRLSYQQIIDLKEVIELRMIAISEGLKDLATSDSCKYCPAAAHCPAFNKAYFRGVEVVHEFLQDSMDESELSFQLDLISRVEDLVKTRKGSLEQLAVDRMKQGKIVPNYVSEQNYGHRKWLASISPEAIKLLTGKDILENTIMSPAKAEKIGVPKELMNSMTERPFIGMKVKRKDTTAMGNKIFGTEQPK